MRCKHGHDLTLPDATNSRGRCRECLRAADRRHRLGNTDQTRGAVVCGRKFCSKCGRWKLAVFFTYENRAGKPFPASWCEACRHEGLRRSYESLRRDKERWARRLELNRFALYKSRRAKGVPERLWTEHAKRLPRKPGKSEALPATPLLSWLDEYLTRTDQPEHPFLENAGVPARRINGLRRGEAENVSLSIVDRLLFAAAEQHRLHELYPLEEVAA